MRYRIHQPLILQRRRHPRRWAVVFTGLVIVVVIAVRIIAAPVEGHTTAVDVHAKRSVHPQTKVLPALTLDNTYFSLKLPTGYKLSTDQTNTGDSLLTNTVTHASFGGSQIIAIAISSAPAGGIQELSAYRARQQNGAYQFTSQSVSGTNMTIATRSDGQEGEVTAFWLRGNYLATIAISTNLGSSADTVTNRETLQTLLGAWRWK